MQFSLFCLALVVVAASATPTGSCRGSPRSSAVAAPEK